MKCSECGEITTHALLRSGPYRDFGEELQRIALGGAPTDMTDAERLRREYRQGLPRNPNLRHRYWMNEAKAAWNADKRVVALCGERITLKREPGGPATTERKEQDGYLVAEQFSDIEYEDPDTGLSWIDMQCVDCCRVSNSHHFAERRTWLEKALAWFAGRPECIEDHEVEGLIEAFALLAEVARQRNQSP